MAKMASKTAFRRFAQAKDFVRKLTLKNQDEWNEYRKAGKRPLDIPSNPYYVYKKQWIGWGDWLGTGATSTHDRKYRSFREAREFARRLGLKNQNKWAIYAKSTKKPSDIPADPRAAYRKDWKGYGDWLGTGNLPPIKRVYRSFEDAKNYVHSLRLNNYVQWIEYRKSSKRPPDIPTSPNVIYRKDWKGYGDWLGTGTVASFNKIYRSFEKAKELSHSLDLKTQSQWSTYCKSGKKPDDIPSYPSVVYKKQWKDWGDWLGTGYIVYKGTSYLPFEEARGFAHRQGLHSVDDWRKYSKSGNRPTNIPSSPDIVYKNDWKGWGDWLGVENDVETNNQYRSFGEAREFVRSLCLKRRQWNEYCKSGKKPDDIPLFPDLVYKKYWKGSADWLGMKHVTAKGLTYKSFEDARKFVRTLELKNADEWNEYCKTGKKPDDIPSYPENKYKKEWGGVGDWLGTGAVASYNMKFLPFTDARLAVHKLQLKSGTEWHNYCKTDQKQKDISSNPDKTYVKEWRGWGDWLGTGAIAPQDRQYRSFEEAREFVQLLDLRSQSEWAKYSKSDRKPDDIPAGPSRVYKKYWKGWGDWLGTGAIAPRNRQYRSFEQAREFAHILGLKSKEDWFNYSLSGKKPSDIPQKPDRVYKSQWKWWADWLGYEGEWNLKKIKELLRDLIASNIIYQWNEAVLYSFLLLKGVLNLTGNRHYQFFKNLIQAGHTDEGRKAIEDYANSDSEIPPDLSDFVTQKIQDPGEEIQAATTQELAQLADKKDPLDYGEIQSVEQILANTSVLESINVDEEAMQFYLTYSIDELWKCAFREEQATIDKLMLEGENGNKYHDTVLETFLSDYGGTRRIEVPEGYAFPYRPTLMQSFVAYKVRTNPFFGNFSATGAGKTLSAVLASRIIWSKMTLIVCPNDVVEQWARNIVEIFPDSFVITGKKAFDATYDENKHQYLVLNYDKFSQADSPNLILNLVKQKVDFVVLDEIHFTKIRYEEDVSKRRQNLDGLMTAVRKKNSQLKVLGLSATPVVNNLTEGKSLLELITGKVYDDIATRPTIPNAVTSYEKLSTISVRELPQYDTHVDDRDIIQVQADRPQNIKIKHLKSNPLSIEQFLTEARIPEIINHIEGQTMIYPEYVTNVIEKLSHAVVSAGYSYALYTGTDHSGLKRFLDKKVQILIASRPISVGVDGLQKICNRLIINTLPWTNAQYQQLLGRLVRKGQIKDVVHVYVIKASIGGYPYDELKWKRIQFKRTLADCAVDGRLPERNLVTPEQAAIEAVKWLERLERGEISSVTRRDLNVELTPVQIKQRIRKYGDFTRLNNKINTENSDTTHRRLLYDPREWEEYHRQYREARKTWSIIPYEEIINRIKELSTRLQIGDFGCGEAKILEVIGKERVYSFDHVAINDNITACDMKSVPLPNDSLDVAVFSLSLMGKNWPGYISEAKRCLATNGYLLIAETTKSLSASGRLSRLKDVIKENGFEIYNDEQRGDFTFIEAREL